MKQLIGIGFVVGVFISSTWAQGNESVQGIWFTPEALLQQSFDWKAQWIWLEKENESNVLLARRAFELTSKELHATQKAQLRISASSHYQLYVNGQYIAQGPSRCAPHHQSFDIWEIERLLQVGKNTLAIRVHYQRGKYSYHFDGRAGLLAQLDLTTGSNGSKSVYTDANWKVSPDPSWSNASPTISRFQLVVSDSVDLGKQLKHWNTSAYEDADWANARPLSRRVGWPSVQKNAQAYALTPPWTSLVPRDVPYVIETEKPVNNLIEAKSLPKQQLDSQLPIPLTGEIDAIRLATLKSFQTNGETLSIPGTDSSKCQFLLFDFGRLYNGTTQLEIEGAKGTTVEVRSAPFIVREQFNHKVIFSTFKDHLTLSGARDKWEATYWKPTRYLALVIDSPSEVKLHKVAIRAISYPFVRKGDMHSEDAPWVQLYMNATSKTLEACTTDGYTDNYRERRQYAQTGYYGAMGNNWIFGDTHLQRRYLVQVAQEQEANGMMPAYAPLAKDDFMIILDSNCLWIRSLREYLLYAGDEMTVRQLLPAARKLMALLHSFTNELGLIDNPPYPYWLDHAVIDRRGANLNLNGHYLGALEDFAEVLNWMGESGSDTCTHRADVLRKSIREYFWDEEKQLFVDAHIDGARSPQAGEHANAMALALGIATPKQAQAVAAQLLAQDELNYVNRASGMVMVTPAMSYFLHKGLCTYGYIDESLSLFRRRFDKMLEPETNQTLFEEWWLDKTGRSGSVKPHSRSDAQTESCFPPALFGEFLLGVKPTQPGMKQVAVYRPNTHLSHIEGQVPSPHGTLYVKWQQISESERELSLEIPQGMSVAVDLVSLQSDKPSNIQVNSKVLSEVVKKSQDLLLEAGKYVIQF